MICSSRRSSVTPASLSRTAHREGRHSPAERDSGGRPVTFLAAAPSSPVTSRHHREGVTVTRIPSHTIENAPDASRPILERMINVSPTGRVLNMHAQMAHSPAVLAAYVSIREANDQHGTLDSRVR